LRPNSSVGVIAVAAAVLLALLPETGRAHWCSNIYQTYARLVVKPERQNINIGVGETGQLKVRVRNNFPYSLHFIKLRSNNPSGLDVCVCPDEAEAENIVVYAGQEETFTLTIHRFADSGDDIAVLNLEVATRVQDISPTWRPMDDWYVDQAPAPSDVRNSIQNNAQQSRALLNANLADLAEQGCPSCETDGVGGLQQLWHARVGSCNASGIDGTNNNQYLRAGLQLAIRLRFRNFTDPSRAEVVQTMIDVMDDAYGIGRGYAAFLAAYGGNDAGVEARIQAMADADDDSSAACSFDQSPNPSAQRMARAALFMLGHDEYQADVEDCWQNDSVHKVRMACAAALGVMGEDTPITDYLIGRLGDGTNTGAGGEPAGYERLFAGYLLHLVAVARRGGPGGEGAVSFLDEADACAGLGTQEVCDGEDNDCDGQVDEDIVGTPCPLQDGVCAGSGETCDGAGGWNACGPASYGPDYEQTETSCDGLDNDCDGQADNGLPAAACPLQDGVCAGSHELCSGAGGWIACGPSIYGSDYEQTETSCDGLDNDCDGQTDEDLTSPGCMLQQGVCAGSHRRCGGAAGWLACDAGDYGADYEQDEATCDSLDNDCDGSTDEGVAACCAQGETRPCSTDEGECTAGEQTCDADGAWGACDGVMPGNEDCDGLDNDCDGQTDEGLDGAACPLQDGVCAGSAQACDGAGGWSPCDASAYGADYESSETRCDGLDNDCDGRTDEDDVCAQPDGGQDGGADGGADAGGSDEDKIVIKGGCGCAGAGTSGPTGLWLLGLIAWALTRRTRTGGSLHG